MAVMKNRNIIDWKKIKRKHFICLICETPIDEFSLYGICRGCYDKERKKDDPEYLKYQKEYQKIYTKRPEVIEKKKKYDKEYYKKPKIKARKKEYDKKYNNEKRVYKTENKNAI